MRVLTTLPLALGLFFASPSWAQPAGPSRHFLVFFSTASGVLDAAGHSVVDQAAALAEKVPGTRLLVTGYADSGHGPVLAHDLAVVRAINVRLALEQDKVPARLIRLRARRSKSVNGQVGRRVEIGLLPPG